jgi:hypothetical protein
MDHDQLFKEVLTTYFMDFLEVICPELAAYVNRGPIEFLDKEVFTDVTHGERQTSLGPNCKNLFSQRDYIYRLQDGGYMLYSVGRNGRDDHGRNALADHLKEFEDVMDPDKVPDDLCIRSLKEKP